MDNEHAKYEVNYNRGVVEIAAEYILPIICDTIRGGLAVEYPFHERVFDYVDQILIPLFKAAGRNDGKFVIGYDDKEKWAMFAEAFDAETKLFKLVSVAFVKKYSPVFDEFRGFSQMVRDLDKLLQTGNMGMAFKEVE